MENEFFEDKDGGADYEKLFAEYLSAKEEGNLALLNFSEEEYESLLDRLVEEGKEDDVLELSQLAFERYPYSSALLTRFCDTLILMGNPDKALDILSAYKDSFSAESAMYILFSRANIMKKKFAHARDYFYKAMELGNDSLNDIDSAEQVCTLAQDCIEVGNYEEALYYLERAQRIAPLPYEYSNDFAFCYDRLDEPQKAIEHYNNYLDKDPFNDTVWFNLGTVQARIREFDKAIEAFDYSIALNPGNSSSMYNLAVVYMNLQRYQEAAQVFEQFVEIDADVLGRLGLGEAYIRMERFQDAITQFEKAGEVSAEALLGIDTVKAILCCRNGEFEIFKELFLKIFNNGTAWLAVVYDMLPFLQGEQWFLDFLETIKKED
ncbi:MAG: tetratricopeptide repeat protein [Bacteroidales bacterium]|nr:tetratricopeptide repeat protein [Bacteroidales bacterium]